MTTNIYWIDSSASGRIGIMPRPRGGEQLRDEIRALREAGVHTLVSLLTEAESFELELPLEAEECGKHQIEFLAFAIKDRRVPSLDYAVLTFVQDLADRLFRGDSVVIHYRMGVGRASIIAACTLVLSGGQPDAVFKAIREARGCEVPDTSEQRQWVAQFAKTHHSIQPTSDLWL
jgi:protein-tyrosine phosphatase